MSCSAGESGRKGCSCTGKITNRLPGESRREVTFQQFCKQLSEYEETELKMMCEYFREDLIHIMESVNTRSLLSELASHTQLSLEKYEDMKTQCGSSQFSNNLFQDIFDGDKKAITGLFEALYILKKSHPHPNLISILDEIVNTDPTIIERIKLERNGDPLCQELQEIQETHKKHLMEQTQTLVEHRPPRCNLERECFNLANRFVNLIVVSTDTFRQRSENELIDAGIKHEDCLHKVQKGLEFITPSRLFCWCHRLKRVPTIVMVSGVPGVGKTTLVQKFVYDWVRKKLCQRFAFVFFFKLRNLNNLVDKKISLDQMILDEYPYLVSQIDNILKEPEKLLFIFDGLDESVHNIDFTAQQFCTNPKSPENVNTILVSLVGGDLLQGCSVLITSRPAKLYSINTDAFQRIVEIMGFFNKERQIYFQQFFNNDDAQTQRALNYVKQNDTLYTFCYIPSYCWITCTVLSRSFQPTSTDQLVSLLPQTVTQLFTIFVANILSNHSLHKSDAQKILQSIGWMAEHGVMNHRIIFDERDLDCFHVDNNSKLLSSFLMESEEHVSYSFLHLTVQDFFSALVHYVDYSPEKLQKSLHKAKSYPDGRGEMFLRFLCGLSDGSTRSMLTGYLDRRATQTSIDVITWLKNFILEEQRSMESKDKKRHLLSTFFYLYESRNKALVQESLQSHRSLDFSGVRMSALDCTVLAFILDTCTNIKELNLHDCSLDNEGLERLVPALHNLKDLSLADNGLQDSSCIPLASVIRNNRSLKKLDLSGNRLSGPHFSDLMEALSSPACRIEELDLSVNCLEKVAIQYIKSALSHRECKLQSLNLAFSCLEDSSVSDLADGITCNRSLRSLNLTSNKLEGPFFDNLVTALSSSSCKIKDLNLSNTGLTDLSCSQLISLVMDSQSLRNVDLSYNKLDGHHFEQLMKALFSPFCRIEELLLWDLDLTSGACSLLALVINNNPSLKKLDLSANNFCGPQFGDLMEAVSRPSCRIEELLLDDTGLIGECSSLLASAIRNNRHLRKLDLSDNKLAGPQFSGFMEALHSPTCRLEELDLSNNGLTDSSCLQLASGIRSNQSLRKLILSYNDLSGPHFPYLIDALCNPGCRIKQLIFHRNKFTDEEIQSLKTLELDKQDLKIFFE